MSIRALGRNVVIKRQEVEEVTTGGIILPEMAQEKNPQAVVVAVGPEVVGVGVGDVVFVSPYSGYEIELGTNDKVLICDLAEILGVKEDK